MFPLVVAVADAVGRCCCCCYKFAVDYHINMLDAANGLLSATFCFSSVA